MMRRFGFDAQTRCELQLLLGQQNASAAAAAATAKLLQQQPSYSHFACQRTKVLLTGLDDY